MAGLGPAIHDFAVGIKGKTWMAGLRRRELQHSLSNGSSITTDRRHGYAYEEPTSSRVYLFDMIASRPMI
jgi:hypothetical protein